MSNEEIVIEQGAGNDPTANLKEQVKGAIAKAWEKQVSKELAEAPPGGEYVWEVYALGPFQTPAFQPPGRIIELGESAFMVTIVFLNEFMRDNLIAFGGEVQLNYYTSNTQTMEAVAAMDYTCCLDPDPQNAPVSITIPGLGTFYITVWTFTPTEAACILETNICARVCNCDDEVVPGFAAFVRWIANVDFDLFFPPIVFTFDHPARYLVYDNDDDTNCDCETQPDC